MVKTYTDAYLYEIDSAAVPNALNYAIFNSRSTSSSFPEWISLIQEPRTLGYFHTKNSGAPGACRFRVINLECTAMRGLVNVVSAMSVYSP